MAIEKGRKSVADRTATLKVGDQAPDFELQVHHSPNDRWRLSEQRGKKNVVLAFYPFAFTPV
ncbi:MAG: hypothetical protein NVS1B14_07150 [Vulcanimicrobiaceae bacterium]